MTMRLNFTLDRQVITRIDSHRVVAGSKGYVAAHFIDVRGDWAVPTTAIFGTYAVLLDDNMDCMVPWEVLADPGAFEVSAFCGDLHTANTARVDVEATGYKKGETLGDPTPDVYATLVAKATNAEKIAKSVRDDADAGRFKGEKGDRGEKGDTGPQGDFTQDQITELQRPATEAATWHSGWTRHIPTSTAGFSTRQTLPRSRNLPPRTTTGSIVQSSLVSTSRMARTVGIRRMVTGAFKVVLP